GPQALLRDINRYLQGEAPVIKAPPPDDETQASRHAQILARIDAVKQQWRDAVGELDALIESSGIDRRKFTRSNQAKWIEKISAWAEEETNSYQLPQSLEKFSQRFLEDRTKAGGETPRHPLFEAIDQLLAEPLSIRDLVITR
ncbi:exodeoxyribonuclease V subunit beta, partial [Escherichia coli]